MTKLVLMAIAQSECDISPWVLGQYEEVNQKTKASYPEVMAVD